MNKYILVFCLMFLLSVVSVSGLSTYATCVIDGNHYVCTNGLPNPNTNFGTYGVVITGNVVFVSSSGTVSSPTAENINLSYNIPGGVEIRDANINITAGSGAQPSSAIGGGDGGTGGSVNIVFNTDKFKMNNVSFISRTGSGGNAYVVSTEDCDANSGGFAGNFILDINSEVSYFYNSSIKLYTGNGGNAYARCSTSSSGAEGGDSGDISVYIGEDDYYNNVDNVTIVFYGGNGGAAQVDAASSARCRNGGVSASYNFYMYGNTVANFLYFNTSNSSTSGLNDCSGATDDSATAVGIAGQPSTNYFTNATFNNSILALFSTSATDCEAIASGTAEASCDGKRGGATSFSGDYITSYNGKFYLISGNGGSADYDTDWGGSCGGGGYITVNFSTYSLYNTSQVLTIGSTGTAVGDTVQHHQGGSGGDVNYYVSNSFVVSNNNITFTPRDGCEAGSDATSTTYGSQFFINGGNVTFYNVTFAGYGGNNSATGDYLESGGVVAFSGDQLSVSSSNLSLIGGNRGLISTGNSGYGMINFSNVSVVNSYIRLHKGNNGTDSTSYQARFLTNGNGVSIFDNSTISFTKNDVYGKNNTFNISNEEVRFYNNTLLNYTSYVPSWSVYANYVYINNATVQSTMQIYNRTTNATIVRYNVSQVGTWTFNGASTGYTYAQYFSRVDNVLVNYNNVVPIRTSSFNCSSSYTLGNGSVSAVYEWFVNGTLNNTGVNFTGVVSPNANLTCRVRLYDTSFNLSSNNTVVINYAYPYNVVFGVDDEVVYTYSSFLNGTSNLSLDVGGFNKYIQYVCNGSVGNCSIPISIVSDINISSVNVTGFVLTYGVDNVTGEDLVIPFVVVSSQSGNINVTNMSINLLADEETSIRVSYNTSDDRNGTYYLTIRNSEVNLTLVPSGVEYWDVLPYKNTQQDVAPFGQTNNIPIFNLTYSANYPFDIYMRFTDGLYPPCANTTVNKNNTNVLGWNINESYTNIYELNSTVNYVSLWTWTDFNCSYSQIKVFYPQIDFKTLCKDCVLTEDFYD